MRFLLFPLLLFLYLPTSWADVQVKGYTRKDGTYVTPHVRSSPNGTKSDNYSTKGNVNPYTGKAGTKTNGNTAASTPVASPSSAQTASAEKVSEKKPVADLSLVTIRMKKADVLVKIGEPSIKTDSSWFYLDSGWVRFKGDLVSNIEAK